MLLQELRTYTRRLTLPPQLYVESPVRYIIDLDSEGRFLGMIDTADPANRATKRGTPRLVPQVQRANVIRPFVLCDRPDYVLGYAQAGDNAARVQRLHEAWVEQLRRCHTMTHEPAVVSVLRFMERQPLVEVSPGADFDGSAIMTFRVAGRLLVDLPTVQAFWTVENDPAARDAPTMQCVVCGGERLVLARLQAKVKGLRSGQTAGTSIISANSDAFESYGLQESFIAPTCADCGERFTKGLNALLASETNCLRMAGAEFVFWTREPEADDGWFFNLLDHPSAEDVHLLLERLHTGGRPPDIDASRFFGCSLSGSGGRAVVRDWIDTTVGEAKDRLAEWFSRQRIVDPFGQTAAPLGIYALAAATVRDARKDLAPPTPRALLRTALTQTQLPPNLLHAAVLRCQVGEQTRNTGRTHVTRQQAALIKLALSFRQSYDPQQEDPLTALDPTNPSPGYRCGRLLAVLEQAQRAAIPGVNQTIVDRYYGTAASSPRSVFSRLLQGAQPHIAKLRRDRRGAAEALNRRIEEIVGGIPGFPAVLSLEEQGLFALGFYHQRADDRARAAEARARRQTGADASPDADLHIDDDTTTKES